MAKGVTLVRRKRFVLLACPWATSDWHGARNAYPAAVVYDQLFYPCYCTATRQSSVLSQVASDVHLAAVHCRGKYDCL